MKLNKNKKYYENSYNDDFPVNELFIDNFNVLPSIKQTNSNYHVDSLNYFIENNFKEYSIYENKKRYKTLSKSFYIHLHKKLYFIVENNTDKLNYIFFYDKQFININDIYNEIEKYVITEKKSNVNLVTSSSYGLDVEEFELKIENMDLLLNYGSNFLNIHDLIIKRLNNKKDKGIILLHGDPGTGKTSYIKYLTSLINEKEILFIPPSMAESLSEPNIIPFLMDHKNSILIIEDAEKVISDRNNNGSSAGVSNILNITDGILGDCLNIQIIATFNMKKEKIDSALLRPGRLIVEHKFSKLNVDESQKLLDHLGKDFKATDSMSLADIYNVDVEIYKTIKEKEKIGF